MAILNITYQGMSADYELSLDFAATDGGERFYLRPKVPFGA
jgi:hypothetical protein